MSSDTSSLPKFSSSSSSSSSSTSTSTSTSMAMIRLRKNGASIHRLAKMADPMNRSMVSDCFDMLRDRKGACLGPEGMTPGHLVLAACLCFPPRGEPLPVAQAEKLFLRRRVTAIGLRQDVPIVAVGERAL